VAILEEHKYMHLVETVSLELFLDVNLTISSNRLSGIWEYFSRVFLPSIRKFQHSARTRRHMGVARAGIERLLAAGPTVSRRCRARINSGYNARRTNPVRAVLLGGLGKYRYNSTISAINDKVEQGDEVHSSSSPVY
jgi:predicted component of viral defense system (DUF524 family)